MSNERWRSLSRRQLRLHGEWLGTHDSSEEIGGEIFHSFLKKWGGKCENKEWTFLLIKIIKLIRASVFYRRDRLKRLTVEHMTLPLLQGKRVLCCCLLYLGLEKKELGLWEHHLLSITCQDTVWSDLHLLTETCRWIPAIIHFASALVLATFWSRIPPFHPILLKTKNLFRFLNFNYRHGLPTPPVTLLLSCFQAVFLPLQYHKY